MDALAVSGFACFANCPNSLLPNSLHPVPYPPKPLLKKNPRLASVLKASYSPVSELAEDDVLQMFLEERAVSGDLISKVCDMFWQRDIVKLADADASKFVDTTLELEQVTEDDDNDGFLKLSGTREWILGASDAPVNKKAIAKALQDDRERRKKLNFLKYEALKRELMFLSIGIGTACCGYCLVTLSLQAAISYAVGVLFSLLYFQLLCQHSDNLSREMIPSIFMQKKAKKIGIRSEDLTDSFEKTIRGSGIALSSPRLVIPAAVYGLWVLCHHYIAIDLFDFQIVPAMFGMFVYKAAALVQVYRDNEDLQLIFPED
ncbi:unnamed protein product [Linum tenue]|uniref:NF-kappa-B inhibitor-like protein 2 n=1 Tax=Linum tenue TaxID=586396 RepID=A0AAV0QF06_9ROSI|nr:unnamed protein product [Linum tenue]